MCLHCLFEWVELILLHPTEEVELNSNGRVPNSNSFSFLIVWRHVRKMATLSQLAWLMIAFKKETEKLQL